MGILDLNDRKILYELDCDSRQSNKQIAKKVRLSEQVVGNRIRRLERLGVIEYFFVKTNPSALGFIHLKVYVRFHNLSADREAEIVGDLMKKNDIYWMSSLRGKYDLVVSIYVRRISEFSTKYEEIFGEWGEYILEREVIVLENAYTYTKSHFLPNKASEEILYSQGEDVIKLDGVDRNLLSVLNREGRKSLVDLSGVLKVSADTVNYRIKNLKKRGIITGFGVKVDFRKLENNYFIVAMKLQNMNKVKYRKLEVFAKKNKNVIIFIKTIGNHDIELEVEVTKRDELDCLIRLLRDFLIVELKDYDILEVVREHRMTYYPF